LEACRRVGVEPNEIYFMDFQSFKTANPGVRNLNKEVQNLRYEHYEKLRQDSIQALKEERNKIIDEQKMGSESKIRVRIRILI
jgi:hypothetical protein